MTECIRRFRHHLCEECGYGASVKNHLKCHMAYVHNMGKTEFKYEQCTYETIEKCNLKQHKDSVHTVGEKMLHVNYVLISRKGNFV